MFSKPGKDPLPQVENKHLLLEVVVVRWQPLSEEMLVRVG